MKRIIPLTCFFILLQTPVWGLVITESPKFGTGEWAEYGPWQIGVTFDVYLDPGEVGTINYFAIGNNDARPSWREDLNTGDNYGADLQWDAPPQWEVIAMTRDGDNKWRRNGIGGIVDDSWLNPGPEEWRSDSEGNAIVPDFSWIDDNTAFTSFTHLFLFYNKPTAIIWETVTKEECGYNEEGVKDCITSTTETGNYTLSGYTVDTEDYYKFSGYTTTMWSPFAALQSDGTVITGEVTHTGAPAPVPEPTTMLLFGAGLAGLAAAGRRKRVC